MHLPTWRGFSNSEQNISSSSRKKTTAMLAIIVFLLAFSFFTWHQKFLSFSFFLFSLLFIDFLFSMFAIAVVAAAKLLHFNFRMPPFSPYHISFHCSSSCFIRAFEVKFFVFSTLNVFSLPLLSSFTLKVLCMTFCMLLDVVALLERNHITTFF